ncbi:claudin-8-like [Gastrophryne carolinensis]
MSSWFLVQVVAIILGGIGMILTWVVTIMPQWRLSVLAENNGLPNGRIDGQWIGRWDGLWTTCVNQGRVSMLCNGYESQVSLTSDLKSGRVLMSFAVTMTFIAFIFSMFGMLLTRCRPQESKETRHCLLVTAGAMYIVTAALITVPVLWTTSNIVRQAYDASVCRGAVRIEMGEALFLAWPTIAFILIAGIILCWRCYCRCKADNCICLPDKRDYLPPAEVEMECRPIQGEARQPCNTRTIYI